MYGFFSQITSYILDILIYVCMILLDNLLKYLLFIAMIDVFRTCDNTTVLICNALVIFMIYPWIKIKLKVCCNTVGKKTGAMPAAVCSSACKTSTLHVSHITLVVVAIAWLVVTDGYGKLYCNIRTSGRI
jgi:hypothetical protein